MRGEGRRESLGRGERKEDFFSLKTIEPELFIYFILFLVIINSLVHSELWCLERCTVGMRAVFRQGSHKQILRRSMEEYRYFRQCRECDLNLKKTDPLNFS